MKTKIFRVVQVLLGLFMVVLGLNKFLVFTPIPSPPGDGGVLMGIYISSGFLKLTGVLEGLGGIALIINKFVPMALIFIVAMMFNAVVFHGLHDSEGIGPAALCLLLYTYRQRFAEVLKA